MTYKEFFRRATGNAPFPYQEKWALQASPSEIFKIPTGAGKTATAILGWLWRRRFGPEGVRASTPRRLVYCLPMRVLVEQVRDSAAEWLKRLGLTEDVGLHVLMGGEDSDNWDAQPERNSILVGTQDMLVSRALNRGYGMSRYRWPMHFGLLNNDCLWVLDEVQLMDVSLATTAQLEAFRKQFKTFGHCRSLWMSATFDREWLKTVDFDPVSLEFLALSEHADLQDEVLRRRWFAVKSLRKASVAFNNANDFAQLIREEHEAVSSLSGDRGLTLVVVNTVKRAVELYEALGKKAGPSPDLLLLHSRFRPRERRIQVRRLFEPPLPEGRIIVSTQVIEAGVDLDACRLFTELAPWPSLVQRFGRCNRRGDFAEGKVYWIDVPDAPKEALPYAQEDLAEARALLTDSGEGVGLAQVSRVTGRWAPKASQVLRRRDLLELFDTTPDLAGNDLDISRYVREGDENDVHVFWRTLDGQAPLPDEAAPARDELCPVPVYAFLDFLKKHKVRAYLWNPIDATWESARTSQVYPGQTFLLVASVGGYDKETGWTGQPNSTNSPVLSVETTQSALESYGSDQSVQTPDTWLTIADHTDRVCRRLDDLLKVVSLDAQFAAALKTAARWHDRGKAHEVFQENLEKDAKAQAILGNKPAAKAPRNCWLGRYKRPHFRHELASALAAFQADPELVPDAMRNLVAYLVAAHHGKVRLSIRSMPSEQYPDAPEKRFARGIWDDDRLPETALGGGIHAPDVVLSLEPMELGFSRDGIPSWVECALNLRDSLGPFRLAYLETLLRIADWHASADTGGQNHE